MMDSYRVTSSGAVKRIGTPHENDGKWKREDIRGALLRLAS